MKTMKHALLSGVALALPLAGCATMSELSREIRGTDLPPAQGTVTETDRGIIVRPESGPAEEVRLTVINKDIIHVEALPPNAPKPHKSLAAVAKPAKDKPFYVAVFPDMVSLVTDELQVMVNRADGTIDFLDENGNSLLEENDRGTFTPVQLGGETLYEIRQSFNQGTDEGFYGLGQHQNGQFNYNGEDVELAQHNISIANPFIMSTKDYGVLWDNYSITRVGDPRPYTPITGSLTVRDADGAEGGLTATYYLDDDVLLTQQEADIDYQYLPADQFTRGNDNRDPYPPAVQEVLNSTDDAADPSLVTWEGSLETAETGTHKFKLYASSYFKVYVDGELIMDRWRQNWNPWYHTFQVDMVAGEPVDIRIEWDPNGGYLRLLHLDPLPAEEQHQLSFASEAGRAIDYYFVSGDDMDDVISGYRTVTGKAEMLPKWAYGFWQSRERYRSQDELLDALKEYRDRHIPIDNIVLDWSYWPADAWGSHDFDAEFFPDPEGMVDQVHDMNAQIMISVWPKFYPTTDNYKELDAAGHMYQRQIEMKALDWIYPGYLNSFYDPYSEEAQEIFWRQIKEKIAVKGFDAWWMDATEPDTHSNLSIEERKKRMEPNALGTGTEYFNSYALMNAKSIYEGEREFDPNDRTFILTRSGSAGIQRYAAALWSGDVVSRWSNLKEQITAGLGVSMSGIPNWTHDIGGFSTENRYAQEDPAHLDEWRALNLRWFQFGAFTPLFRSHGQYPYREFYNIAEEGSEEYASFLWYDQLRYRLMPYIYTAGADLYHKDYTFMRGLVMDFDDPAVKNLGTQYMFGDAFLVTPVTEYQATEWDVYLPAGTAWYDFATGTKYQGGQTVTADAPLARMPLFVKAGSIVPTGPEIEYTAQDTGGKLTVTVWAGADGSYSLYEDDGDTYDFKDGAYARIPMTWDDASATLTLGAREGSFPGMYEAREISVRVISGVVDGADDFDANIETTVTYTGEALEISL